MALHLLLGWAWSMGGGIIVGLYNPRRAWLWGGISVGLDWALFVLHAFIVAAEPTWRLTDILGAMFGNIPGALIPFMTVFVGILIGIAGGSLGSSIQPIVAPLLGKLNQNPID